MSWESWLTRNGAFVDGMDYDAALRFHAAKHNLMASNRHMAFMDKKHFLIKWWWDNKKHFQNFQTYTSIAELLCMDHSTVQYHVKSRKKSHRFEKNTKEINESLNQC